MAVLYLQVVFNIHDLFVNCILYGFPRPLWAGFFCVRVVRVTQHSVVVGLTVSAVYETCCECRCLSVDRSAQLQ